jgi:glycosyltransferase involved in cell wall biosynthesis
MELISIVIPCYNPTQWLREAVESARSQTHRNIEIILVDDGSTTAEGKECIRSIAPQVTRIIEQTHQGPAAARNRGMEAAASQYILPLDSDDVLKASFIEQCFEVLECRPEIAFVYSDYRVFGEKSYVERLPDYNLYGLLQANTVCGAALLRKSAWAAAGGYDSRMQSGYEDWDFWLRLGARKLFGYRLPKVLFGYRKHGHSVTAMACRRHDELVAQIRRNHPDLYSSAGYARVKAEWQPAVCILDSRPAANPEIADYETSASVDPREILRTTKSPAYLIAGNSGADAQSAELAALAVWGGSDWMRLPDGSLAVSRARLAHCRDLAQLERRHKIRVKRANEEERISANAETIRRHLVNAQVLSWDAWWKHPLRSAGRLIPLRAKEGINQLARRNIVELSFYLRFQPRSILLNGAPLRPLEYIPAAANRRRVALLTPHLGPGGAETVLLEIAGACDRAQFEVFLIATHSQDDRWIARWRQHTDHIYDLARIVPPERTQAAIYALATNWRFDFILIQNSLLAYSIIPQLKTALPGAQIMDLVHAVDPRWDFVSTTQKAAPYLDVRIGISEASRARLLEAGVATQKVRLIRNGIQLDRFTPAPVRQAGAPHILFAGRLDPVKRPLMLVEIAANLRRNGWKEFRFTVAGEGIESRRLRAKVRRAGLEDAFVFLGEVSDMPQLFAEADMLVITSRNEGIPLVALEAMASARPVVAADAGAIGEVVDSATGVLIQKSAREVEQFADAIRDLMGRPDLRERLGQEGRRRVEADYDRHRAMEAYRELFK